jgi:hypothetical protein
LENDVSEVMLPPSSELNFIIKEKSTALLPVHRLSLRIIRGIHGGEVEVVVFWVALRILVYGNQRFGDRAASIFRVELRDQGEVSVALLPNQRGSLYVRICSYDE